MKRILNNKGMTTVEILVSFVLVAIISASLYTTINGYNRKMERENFKLEINKYKNILTKEIQDDIIKGGLITTQIKEFHSEKTLDDGTKVIDPENPDDIYVVDLELKDHSVKRLAVRRRLAEYYVKDASDTDSSLVDDYFMVYYGTPLVAIGSINTSNYMNGLEEFPIPDVGEGENDQTCPSPAPSHKCIVKDLRLTNVIIKNENKVLSIFLGFQHIDEGTRYAINIVCPTDFKYYSSSSSIESLPPLA